MNKCKHIHKTDKKIPYIIKVDNFSYLLYKKACARIKP